MLTSVRLWLPVIRAQQLAEGRKGPKEVRVYTIPGCRFCTLAKALLKKRGIPYSEIDVSRSRGERAKLIERSGGRRTVPQIFIGETHLGGYGELEALDSQGKLKGMVRGAETGGSG